MDSDLNTELAEIRDRLTRLETRTAPESTAQRPPPGELDLPLLEQLGEVSGDDHRSGAVRIIGSVRLGEERAAWHVDRSAGELADVSPTQVAAIASALAHPTRASLVQALLEGPRTAAELTEAVGAPSPGKLYHHLDKLVNARIIAQDRRGIYRLPAAHIVPILAIMSAVIDLAGGGA